jgi:16S rRNA (guanine966-N2)-methyltransferase
MAGMIITERSIPVSRKRKTRSNGPTDRGGGAEAEVRIIGGAFRGRRLQYHGDPVVRPMKHRTREAIFNLISTECAGRHAIDLFAGTGALGLEALSRGAAEATFIEKHVPSARIVQENIRTLGVEDRATLLVTSAFLWGKRDLANVGRTTLSVDSDGGTDRIFRPTGEHPWLVFCSPPYAFYHERQAEMFELVRRIQTNAPAGSILVIEADEPFDFQSLCEMDGTNEGAWDIRSYPPAKIGLWRK